MIGVIEEEEEGPLERLHEMHSQSCLARLVQKGMLTEAFGRLVLSLAWPRNQSAQTKFNKHSV